MKVIILAAGRGSRLGKLTEDKPKCLLNFGNETILERQIRILQSCGIKTKDIVIVAGYKRQSIQEKNPLKIIYNERYFSTDNSYSLCLAVQDLDEDILVLDGDLIFEETAVYDLLSCGGSAVLAIKAASDYGSTGISFSSTSMRVTGIGKHINSDAVYASMMKIVRADLPALKNRLSQDGMEKTWYTVPLNQLVRQLKLYAVFTESRILGINSYFEYIKAKRDFGIEDFSILVTGASGFLGKKVYHILKRNYTVEGVKGPNSSLPMDFLELTDKNMVDAYFELKKPQVVIHTANIADPDVCEKNKALAYQANVETTRILTQICRARNIKLIYISTDYVFDGESCEPYYHLAKRCPKNYYGQTKCLAEDIVGEYDNSLIVRIPILYGYNDENDRITFPIKVLKNLEKAENIFLDNKQVRYPVLIDEVALKIEQALRKNGIVHITSQKPVTKYTWARTIAKEFGYDENLIHIDEASDLENRPAHIQLGISESDFIISDVETGTRILKKQQSCAFKLIYKSSPVDHIYGKVVGEYRYHLGKLLGRSLPQEILDKLDIVVPVPSSGLYYAMGMSEETKIPYLQALVKPDTSTRSFQIADISAREQIIRSKIIPIEDMLKGRTIALVDEAIFTGTTLRLVCDMVKACGAKGIYICLPTPICRNKCRQYVQPDRELLSGKIESENLKDYFKVDGVFFQPYGNFEMSVLDIKNICFDCFYEKELEGKNEG